jgi:hypothetical protein
MTRCISRNPAAASAVVVKRQAFDRTEAELDETTPDRGRVSSVSLFDHFPGLIDAGDMPGGRQPRQALKNHSWSEADFQHPVICCDLKKVGDPGTAIGIRAGHDETPQPDESALGPAKRAHQNALYRAH